MEPVIQFLLNDRLVETGFPRGSVTLDYLRSTADLKGTKEGCREGDCGACLVLIGELEDGALRYRSVNSCLLPLGEVEGCHLVTIEGLNQQELTPIQQAIVDQGATQCGFCTPGIVVALTGFLLGSPRLDATEAVTAIAGNICRCTGYASILRAIDTLLHGQGEIASPGPERLDQLIRSHVLPPYFAGVQTRLQSLLTLAEPERPEPGEEVVAGGTDLYVQRPHTLVDSEVFLLSRAELGGIRVDEQFLHLGATTTMEEMRTSPEVRQLIPGMERFSELISAQPIRNRATVAGNIVNASPIGDLSIILLALDAELCLVRGERKRSVPLRSFFTGYKQLLLEPGELVERIRIARRFEGGLFNFEKVCKRAHLDIASVNTAMAALVSEGRIVEAHISAGGVAPIPLYLQQASALLVGQAPSADLAFATAASAESEISPISDVRGSADYKRLLLRQLILAHFHALFQVEERLLAGEGSQR